MSLFISWNLSGNSSSFELLFLLYFWRQDNPFIFSFSLFLSFSYLILSLSAILAFNLSFPFLFVSFFYFCLPPSYFLLPLWFSYLSSTFLWSSSSFFHHHYHHFLNLVTLLCISFAHSPPYPKPRIAKEINIRPLGQPSK